MCIEYEKAHFSRIIIIQKITGYACANTLTLLCFVDQVFNGTMIMVCIWF